MKKAILLLALVYSSTIINAQFYAGLQTKAIASKNNYILDNDNGKALAINYGLGSNIIVGYSLNENIDFTIDGDMSWLFSASSNSTFNNANLGIRYSFPDVFVKPYVGLYIGYSQKTFRPISDEIIMNPVRGVSVSPSVGVMFNPKMSRHFWINTELTYTNVFSEIPFNIINLQVGLYYYF